MSLLAHVPAHTVVDGGVVREPPINTPMHRTAAPASHGRRWPTSSAPPGTAPAPAASGRARAPTRCTGRANVTTKRQRDRGNLSRLQRGSRPVWSHPPAPARAAPASSGQVRPAQVRREECRSAGTTITPVTVATMSSASRARDRWSRFSGRNRPPGAPTLSGSAWRRLRHRHAELPPVEK